MHIQQIIYLITGQPPYQFPTNWIVNSAYMSSYEWIRIHHQGPVTPKSISLKLVWPDQFWQKICWNWSPGPVLLPKLVHLCQFWSPYKIISLQQSIGPCSYACNIVLNLNLFILHFLSGITVLNNIIYWINNLEPFVYSPTLL